MRQLADKLMMLPAMGLSMEEVNRFLVEPVLGREVTGDELLDLTLGIRPEWMTDDQEAILEAQIDKYFLLRGDITPELGLED